MPSEIKHMQSYFQNSRESSSFARRRIDTRADKVLDGQDMGCKFSLQAAARHGTAIGGASHVGRSIISEHFVQYEHTADLKYSTRALFSSINVAHVNYNQVQEKPFPLKFSSALEVVEPVDRSYRTVDLVAKSTTVTTCSYLSTVKPSSLAPGNISSQQTDSVIPSVMMQG